MYLQCTSMLLHFVPRINNCIETICMNYFYRCTDEKSYLPLYLAHFFYYTEIYYFFIISLNFHTCYINFAIYEEKHASFVIFYNKLLFSMERIIITFSSLYYYLFYIEHHQLFLLFYINNFFYIENHHRFFPFYINHFFSIQCHQLFPSWLLWQSSGLCWVHSRSYNVPNVRQVTIDCATSPS